MKFLITTTLCLLGAFSASAQLEKTLHQTFDPGDTKSLSLDIPGDYTIQYWASSYVMTETHVQLFGASPSILNHLVDEEHRYQFDSDMTDGKFKLVNHDKKQEDIHTHFGSLTEVVKVKIFIPENYRTTSGTSTVFERKEDALSKQ